MNNNMNINALDSGYHYNQHKHGFEEHNIDSGIIEEDIFAVHQSKSTVRTPPFNGPRMAKNKWLSLTKQEQQSWDTFSNQSKAIILGIADPKPILRFEVNLHNISVAEYMNMLHSTESSYGIETNKTATTQK